MLENSAPDFVTSGALVPLDDTLDEDRRLRASTTSPRPRTKLWQTGGKLYAYPFSTSPFGVFVNNDLLKQAGQQTPAELIAAGKWNWDTALAAASAVNAKTGKAGLVVRDFDYKGWDNLSSVWTGWGAQAWSADGKTCGFNKPEMVEAMTVPAQGDLHRQGAARPGHDRRLLRRRRGHDDHPDLPGLAAQGREVRLGPGAAAGRAEGQVRGDRPGRPRRAEEGQERRRRPPTSWPSSPTPPTRPSSPQYFPPPRQSQLNAETLAKTNPLLKPEQLQQVVIDGIATGVVKPSHSGQAELSQAVRAALDPLWKPDAERQGACSTASAPRSARCWPSRCALTRR